MTKQGEISVFLSLILVCILSLFLGLVESARLAGARLYLEMAAGSSMDSVMSQYNQNLWDMYHLLFLEAESNKAVEESFASYLEFYLEQENLYPMKISNISVIESTRMTEKKGRALEEEIISCVKSQFPQMITSMSGIEAILDVIEDMEQGTPDWDTAEEYMDMVTNSDGEEEIEIDWDKVRLLDRLAEILRGDVLDLILGKDVDVSMKSVRLKGIPSAEYRKEIESVDSNVIEQWIVGEYCRMNFDSYLNRCERKLTPHHQALQYEQEYILFGKDSDRKNLKKTIERLLTVRGALNLSYLLQNPECRKEVDVFTLTISGGNLYIQSALSVFILSLWSFAEAVWDVKILMRGDPVPFFKQKSQWKLGIEKFLSMQFLDNPPESGADGANYQDYLRILLFLADRTDRNYRIMDVIQWNVQSVQEDFLVQDCISKVNIQVTVEEQHLFLKHGMFSRETNVSGSY